MFRVNSRSVKRAFFGGPGPPDRAQATVPGRDHAGQRVQGDEPLAQVELVGHRRERRQGPHVRQPRPQPLRRVPAVSEQRELGVRRDGRRRDPDQGLDHRPAAADEPAEALAGHQVLPGAVEVPLGRPGHRPARQGEDDSAALLNVRQQAADQSGGRRVWRPRYQRVEIVRPPARLDGHGQRLLVLPQPGGDLGFRVSLPRPVLEAGGPIVPVPLPLLRVIEQPEHVGRRSLEVRLNVLAPMDEVRTVLRRRRNAQPPEVVRRHGAAFGVRAEGLPE